MLLLKERPDAILLAGDTLERHKEGESEWDFLSMEKWQFLPEMKSPTISLMRVLDRLVEHKGIEAEEGEDLGLAFLNDISKLAPVFMSVGNHEWYFTAEDEKFFADHNITVLDNAEVQVTIKAFHDMGCYVAAVCESGLDVCALSRYVDKVIKDKSIHDRPDLRVELVKREVSKEKYTLVVACSDVTAEQIAIHKQELEAYTKVSVVDKVKFYLAFDKMETMRICMENNIPCPKTYLDIQTIDELKKKEITYPVIIKPREGYGAIGFHKFDDEHSLMSYLGEHESEIKFLIIQEYIPQTDIQYEAAMFVDENNTIKSTMVFEKNRWFPVHGGSSTCNTSVHDDDIVRNCSKLMQTIQWRGCADIDLIRDPRDGV